MTLQRRPARFLASVRAESEARLAAACGADIIDCKDPAAGALGALPHAVVQAIRATTPRDVAVSATIGDLACEPDRVAAAVAGMAATGVDLVKVGLFPGGDAAATLSALGSLDLGSRDLRRCRLVGVLVADLEPEFGLLEDMARAGFAGAMLDTAGKSGRTLVDVMPRSAIASFIARAHGLGLMAGLAGSLSREQIPELLGYGPDVLGFRGALCREARREQEIDADRVRAVRGAIPRLPDRREGEGRARLELST
jgi:uncharacterized protein (UPF0264 family)